MILKVHILHANNIESSQVNRKFLNFLILTGA